MVYPKTKSRRHLGTVEPKTNGFKMKSTGLSVTTGKPMTNRHDIFVLCSSCELVRLMPGYELVHDGSTNRFVRVGRDGFYVAHQLAEKLLTGSVRAIDVMPSSRRNSGTGICLSHVEAGELSYIESEQGGSGEHRDDTLGGARSIPCDRVPSDQLSAYVANLTGVLIIDSSLPAPILRAVIRAVPNDLLVFAVVTSDDRAEQIGRSLPRIDAIAMTYGQAAMLNGAVHPIDWIASGLAERSTRTNSVLFISNGNKEAALATGGVVVKQAPPRDRVVNALGVDHNMVAELFAGLITKIRTQKELMDHVLLSANSTSVTEIAKPRVELLTNDVSKTESRYTTPVTLRATRRSKIGESLIGMMEGRIEPKQALKEILTVTYGRRRSFIRNIFVDLIARKLEPKFLFNVVFLTGVLCIAACGNSH